MINLIDEYSNFNLQLKQFPTATLTISILGTQSSGKSTLLNHLFETTFPILDTTKSRNRCTKGVWLQAVPNFNILDTEGFDSSDRSQDEKLFQKQISLFCVVVSDVILINVFMNEVGRYSGGHLDVLQALLIVGERLASPQQKKIIYVIRDCTQQAEHRILQEQLSRQIKSLTDKYKNKQLKFVVQFFFMSNYIYQPQNFAAEAKMFLPMISVRRQSTINSYKQQDRVKYLIDLWNKIRDSKNEVDLKSIDEALKNFVLQRIKTEVFAQLQNQLKSITTLAKAKSYEAFIQGLKKQSFNYLTENRPKHIKSAQLEAQNFKIFQIFQPAAVKHFNVIILKHAEAELQKMLQTQIDKNKQNHILSHLILKKKKQVTQIYKKLINSHKEYSYLLKKFSEKISEIISKQERKLNHLFSQFQSKAQIELNKLLDQQAQKLAFKVQEIHQKIKQLCHQHKYNEWQIDFKQIWEKVSYRCTDKNIPQIISQKSQKSCKGIGIFAGDQTTSIIAYHTQLQKKALDFCRQIMAFLNQQSTIIQPLNQIKEVVSECLTKRLVYQQKRWKLSLFLVSLLFFLLYKQFEALLWMLSVKKKKIKLFSRIYFWSALILFIFSFFNQVIRKRKEARTTFNK